MIQSLDNRCQMDSREGRIVLVQFNSMGDPENGGRFTVKKYQSAKTLSEDAWKHDSMELLPLTLSYKATLHVLMRRERQLFVKPLFNDSVWTTTAVCKASNSHSISNSKLVIKVFLN